MRIDELRALDRFGANVPTVTTVEELLDEYLNLHPEVFVSMTELPKLGINPNSSYSTPIGVYAYPADYAVQRKISNLPYKHDAPYVNIFTTKIDANTLYLNHYNDEQFNKDCETLKVLFDEKVFKEQLRLAIQDARSNLVGERLWFLTSNLSKYYKDDTRASVAWNKLLRLCGYDYVIDNGDGIIHGNEPTQAVILNPTIITILNRVENPIAKRANTKLVLDPITTNKILTGAIIHKDVDHFKSLGFDIALVKEGSNFSPDRGRNEYYGLIKNGSVLSNKVARLEGYYVRPLSAKIVVFGDEMMSFDFYYLNKDAEYLTNLPNASDVKVLDRTLYGQMIDSVKTIASKPIEYWVEKDAKMLCQLVNSNISDTSINNPLVTAIMNASASFRNKLATIAMNTHNVYMNSLVYNGIMYGGTTDMGPPGSPWHKYAKELMDDYSPNPKPKRLIAPQVLNLPK